LSAAGPSTALRMTSPAAQKMSPALSYIKSTLVPAR
jgi:hypothetical protein